MQFHDFTPEALGIILPFNNRKDWQAFEHPLSHEYFSGLVIDLRGTGLREPSTD